MNKRQFFQELDKTYDSVGEKQTKDWMVEWMEERFGGYYQELRPAILEDLLEEIKGATYEDK